MKGDLVYTRIGDKIELKKMKCDMCGRDTDTEIKSLPLEFNVKIECCIRNNTFENPVYPKFEEYKPYKFIQYQS